MPRVKRNKMEIYNDILIAIRAELYFGNARPTRVQLKSNMAYDRLMRYLEELASRGMITREPLVITERGREFLRDYDRIRGFLREMGVKYLTLPRRGVP